LLDFQRLLVIHVRLRSIYAGLSLIEIDNGFSFVLEFFQKVFFSEIYFRSVENQKKGLGNNRVKKIAKYEGRIWRSKTEKKLAREKVDRRSRSERIIVFWKKYMKEKVVF